MIAGLLAAIFAGGAFTLLPFILRYAYGAQYQGAELAGAFAIGLAIDLAIDLAIGLATGLAGAVFRALRGGATLARAGADGFDFVALFFDFATALAMTLSIRERTRNCAPYTTLARPVQAGQRSI